MERRAKGVRTDLARSSASPPAAATQRFFVHSAAAMAVSPNSALTLNGSTLYGTTSYGGANNDGTIFSIATSGGNPTTLYSFNGNNGEDPLRGLTPERRQTLYGITYFGGARCVTARLSAANRPPEYRSQLTTIHLTDYAERALSDDALHFAHRRATTLTTRSQPRFKRQRLAGDDHAHFRYSRPRRKSILHRVSNFHAAGRQYAFLHG